MFCRDPETGRRAIVEDIDCEALEADHLGEAVDDLGDVIEGVGEHAARHQVGLSEAGQIGSHDMIAIGKMRDEVTKHVARAREAV